jgi:hypothetical protein
VHACASGRLFVSLVFWEACFLFWGAGGADIHRFGASGQSLQKRRKKKGLTQQCDKPTIVGAFGSLGSFLTTACVYAAVDKFWLD